MATAVKDTFYIDRMFGFPIIVPVKKGIVQKFDDHEYEGLLSSMVVGQHISKLVNICKKQLHKSWVKNYELGIIMDETELRNKEFYLDSAKKDLELIKKTSSYDMTSLSQKKRELTNQIAKLETEVAKAEKIVNKKKEQIFQEHGIQL